MGKVFYLVFGCWLSTTIGIIIYACLNSTTTTTITTTTTTTKQSAKMSNKNITGPNNNITINRNKDNLKEALLNTDDFANNLTLPLPSPPQNAELAEYETDENELGINEAEGGDISVDESQDEAAVTHLHNSGKDSGAANSFATTTTTKTTSPSTVASTAPRNGKRKKKEEVAAICVGCSPQSIAGVKKAKKANNGATTSPNEIQTATAAMKHECQQCQQFQKCLKSLMKTLETFINA